MARPADAPRGPGGAIELMQEKLAALRAKRGSTRKGRKWLCRVLAERALEATAELIVEAEERQKRRRKRKSRRGREDEEDEMTDSSDEEELGAQEDTAVRRTAKDRPGALLQSTIVMMKRHLGGSHHQGETEGAIDTTTLGTNYLNKALGQPGIKVPFRCERELRTLAAILDELLSGRIVQAGDLLVQRLRALEASLQEDGGWSTARHLEVVPDSRVTTVTPSLKAMASKTERDEQKSKAVLQSQRQPSREAGASWWKRGESGSDAEELPSAITHEGLEKPGKGKGPGRGQEKGRGKGRKRLNDLARGSAIPRPGIYIGRSRGEFGKPQGWGNPWKLAGASDHEREDVTQKCAEYLRSEAGRWVRYRLHELRGAKLYCHCDLDQPCHGDVLCSLYCSVVSQVAGEHGQLPSLEGLCPAEVGLALKCHLCFYEHRHQEVLTEVAERCCDVERGAATVRDLLPFPLSPLPTDAEKAPALAASRGEAVTTEMVEQAGLEAWMYLIKWSLNQLNRGGGRRRSCVDYNSHPGDLGTSSCNGTEDELRGSAGAGSAAQQAALDQLRLYVSDFVKGHDIPIVDWAETLRHARLDYQGEEMKVPEKVTWEQIEPALPPVGQSARVRATGLVQGVLKHYLENPQLCLLPEGEWPPAVPTAKVWVDSEAEWHRICQGAARRGIFSFISARDVFKVKGVPVLNGLFGVPKRNKKLPGTDKAILRLILNAIPTNSYQKVLEADIRCLPYYMQWAGIQLEDEQVLVWSESDMTSAFYNFQMEPEWLKYQAIGRAVPGRIAAEFCPHLANEEVVYPAMAVMAMGWQSACGILQHIHRNLCFLPPPMGAGLDPSREVRRDAPLPGSMDPDRRSFFTVYLDGFSQGELQDLTKLAMLKDLPDETAAVHEMWDAWGIPRQTGKEEHRALELDVLGCRLSGELGRLVLPRSTVAELMSLSAWFTAPGPRTQLEAQIFGGRWARAFQTRRELSCVFHEFWAWLTSQPSGKRRKELTPEVRDEIRTAVYLLPLCLMDLRAHVSPLVVASDASESGMGVCRTSSLTPLGLEALAVRLAAQPRHQMEVGLIEVRAGIGGLRAALAACGVHPEVYCAIEVDSMTSRVVEAAWPAAILEGEAQAVGKSQLRKIVEKAPHVKLWVLGGIIPLKPGGSNSRLARFDGPESTHQEILRLARDLRSLVMDLGIHVATYAECDAGIDDDVCRTISKHFGVRPAEICPSARIPMKRPRLYWISWKIKAADGFSVTPGSTKDILHFHPVKPRLLDKAWMDPGWQRTTASPLPIFVAPVQHADPPQDPAGLDACDKCARARWADDNYRFPPLQYQWKYGMVRSKPGEPQWRYPNAREREKLLGYPPGYTEPALRTAAGHAEREDARLGLLGNALHTGVAAFLLARLFEASGIPSKDPAANFLVIGEERPHPQVDNPGVEMVRELVRRQAHTGRELRRHGPMDHPGLLPRQTLQESWWKWRRVFGVPWSIPGEHINVLELRAILAALQWRLRAKVNVHSRGLHGADSFVALGALAKGRSASKRLAPVITRINALLLASSFWPLWGYFRTDLNPADAPSREQ
ncbi:unnamed protein product [Prorocentrum cordatum]|uniref:DUF4326 domain-containing protein n=1 Tax=Prorocentrum cordatum TaxID=2364126 RepID=A0ABN9QE73_9DINO|nr:unnamed protein product [Polarella glacialis]